MAKVHTLALNIAVSIVGQETPHFNLQFEIKEERIAIVLGAKGKKALSVDLLLTL